MKIGRKNGIESGVLPYLNVPYSGGLSFFENANRLVGKLQQCGVLATPTTEVDCSFESEEDQRLSENGFSPMELLEPTPFREILNGETRYVSPSSSPFRRETKPLNSPGYMAIEDPITVMMSFEFSPKKKTEDFQNCQKCPFGDSKISVKHSPLPPDNQNMADQGSSDMKASFRESPQPCSDDSKDRNHIREDQHRLWEKNFKYLVNYMHVHGNCDVPHGCSQHVVLARWVKRQRHQYRLFESGMPSTVTPHRIERLESLGFVWKVHSCMWERRFTEYVKHQNAHGRLHPLHSTAIPKHLQTWIKQQRRQYRKFCQGLHSTITLEKIERLQSAGFVWAVRCMHRERQELQTHHAVPPPSHCAALYCKSANTRN